MDADHAADQLSALGPGCQWVGGCRWTKHNGSFLPTTHVSGPQELWVKVDTPSLGCSQLSWKDRKKGTSLHLDEFCDFTHD